MSLINHTGCKAYDITYNQTIEFTEDRNGFGKDYTQDQLTTLKSRFEEDDRGYNFTTWNRLRESDGILCRTDYDCLWISGRFLCQREDLTLSPEVRKKLLASLPRLRGSLNFELYAVVRTEFFRVIEAFSSFG